MSSSLIIIDVAKHRSMMMSSIMLINRWSSSGHDQHRSWSWSTTWSIMIDPWSIMMQHVDIMIESWSTCWWHVSTKCGLTPKLSKTWKTRFSCVCVFSHFCRFRGSDPDLGVANRFQDPPRGGSKNGVLEMTIYQKTRKKVVIGRPSTTIPTQKKAFDKEVTQKPWAFDRGGIKRLGFFDRFWTPPGPRFWGSQNRSKTDFRINISRGGPRGLYCPDPKTEKFQISRSISEMVRE